MKQTLFDSFADIDRDLVVDYCYANDIEVPEENSNKELDIKYGLKQTEEEWFIEDIQRLEYPVLVTGSLGLWNGRPTIVPKRYDSVYDALIACVSNMDDYCVTLEKGTLSVNAYHHDGCNTFEIHKLSKQGRNLTEDTFYSKEPKSYWFSKIIWW